MGMQVFTDPDSIEKYFNNYTKHADLMLGLLNSPMTTLQKEKYEKKSA